MSNGTVKQSNKKIARWHWTLIVIGAWAWTAQPKGEVRGGGAKGGLTKNFNFLGRMPGDQVGITAENNRHGREDWFTQNIPLVPTPSAKTSSFLKLGKLIWQRLPGVSIKDMLPDPAIVNSHHSLYPPNIKLQASATTIPSSPSISRVTKTKILYASFLPSLSLSREKHRNSPIRFTPTCRGHFFIFFFQISVVWLIRRWRMSRTLQKVLRLRRLFVFSFNFALETGGSWHWW